MINLGKTSTNLSQGGGGVQKHCSNCFVTHPRRNCTSKKVLWTQYVLIVMEKHPQIPSKLYGKCWKVIKDEFGPIIEEGPETIPRKNSSTEPQTEVRSQNPKGNDTMLSHEEEEENLSDLLTLSAYINPARAAF